MFTDTEVHKILVSLDPNKVGGIDDIGPQVLKACSLSFD